MFCLRAIVGARNCSKGASVLAGSYDICDLLVIDYPLAFAVCAQGSKFVHWSLHVRCNTDVDQCK